jgi:hypothetical protein
VEPLKFEERIGISYLRASCPEMNVARTDPASHIPAIPCMSTFDVAAPGIRRAWLH